MGHKVKKGTVMVTMQELRKHLEVVAGIGVVDVLERMWEYKKINWDVDHMMHKIDTLEEGTTYIE